MEPQSQPRIRRLLVLVPLVALGVLSIGVVTTNLANWRVEKRQAAADEVAQERLKLELLQLEVMQAKLAIEKQRLENQREADLALQQRQHEAEQLRLQQEKWNTLNEVRRCLLSEKKHWQASREKIGYLRAWAVAEQQGGSSCAALNVERADLCLAFISEKLMVVQGQLDRVDREIVAFRLRG